MHRHASSTQDELIATTDSVEIVGAGQYLSPAVEHDEPGTVYWREKLYVPGVEEPAHVGDPRLPNESTLISEVTTLAQPVVMVGTPLVDQALVTGSVPEGSYLMWKLYRQIEGEDVSLDELIATTDKVEIDGAGEYYSPALTYDETGTAYWREELYVPESAEPLPVGEPRLPNESTDIVKVTAKAQATVEVGTPLVDTAFVEGSVPAGVWLTWSLYRQVDGDDPTQDILITTTEKVEVDGAGEYLSPKVIHDQPGTVYWREALFVPGKDEALHIGEPRLANETTVITEEPPVTAPPDDSPADRATDDD